MAAIREMETEDNLLDDNGPNPYDPKELLKDSSLMAELEELERRVNGINITKSPEVKNTVSEAKNVVSPEPKSQTVGRKPAVSNTAPSTKKIVTPVQKVTPIKTLPTLYELENELKNALAYAFKESKDARQAGDNIKAQKYFTDYKYYDEQMKELIKIKDNNGLYPSLYSPIFHWIEEKSEIKKENLDLGEDQVFVSVDEARELKHVLSNNYEGYTVNCEYNLGIPKDDRIVGTFQGKCLKDGIIRFNYKKIHKCEKKISKAQKTYYTHGYATFKLTLQSFWGFKSTELGTAIFPLEELMSCSDKVLECRIVEDKNEKLSKAKQLPGMLIVHIRLRQPLVNPHVELVCYRKLIIGDLMNHVAPNNATIESDTEATIVTNKPSKYKDLQKKELEDPLAVIYMTSIHVYQSKIEELKQLSGEDEEKDMENNMTILACQNLINHLIEQANSGKLTPEVYGAQLKDRVSRDKLLIEYFTENPNEEYRKKIQKRIELIENELEETGLT